jgi:acetylornithine deacetylase
MGDCTDADAFSYVSNIIPEISGKVSYGSEGGVFEKQGNIPSIICGPGSIRQAHKPNEFIEISQIEECLEFLDALTNQAIAA